MDSQLCTGLFTGLFLTVFESANWLSRGPVVNHYKTDRENDGDNNNPMYLTKCFVVVVFLTEVIAYFNIMMRDLVMISSGHHLEKD